MATEWWTMQRGGTEREYEIYRALRASGRREPQDFTFSPEQGFRVNSPDIVIRMHDAQRYPMLREQTARESLVRNAIESDRREYITRREDVQDAVSRILAGSRAPTAPGE